MKTSDNFYERRVQNQFGGFCTRVLKNEAHSIREEYKRRNSFEKSLDSLSDKELSQLSVVDGYFEGEHIFCVLGKEIVINGDALAEALKNLPSSKRDVILLSYFLGMTDREIGEHLKTIRQTVSKRRTSTLKELREYLEKEGFEWPLTT